MEFEKLFEKALNGRTLKEAEKDWKIPYTNLQRYSKAARVPDYQTAMILSREAGIEPGEVMAILARLEARKKPRSLFPDLGYATTAALIVVNLFVTPSPSEAAPLKKVAAETLCIMSNNGSGKYRLKSPPCRKQKIQPPSLHRDGVLDQERPSLHFLIGVLKCRADPQDRSVLPQQLLACAWPGSCRSAGRPGRRSQRPSDPSRIDRPFAGFSPAAA